MKRTRSSIALSLLVWLTSVSPLGAGPQDFIDCSGRLAHSQVFELWLAPGERLLEVLVEDGQEIQRGDPLARLANESLTTQVATVHRELMTLKTETQAVELLNLKIRLTRQVLARLETQIADERQVQLEIPDYLIDGKLHEWSELKRQKTDELEVLEKELEHLSGRGAERSSIQDTLSKALVSLREQCDLLEVAAPFNGRVVKLRSTEDRVRPGDLVLKLANESALQVEALVWQHQLPGVRLGSRVEIFPDFYDDLALRGWVREIREAVPSPKEDGFPAFPVIIELDNADPNLVVGMRVAVKIFSDAGDRGGGR